MRKKLTAGAKNKPLPAGANKLQKYLQRLSPIEKKDFIKRGGYCTVQVSELKNGKRTPSLAFLRKVEFASYGELSVYDCLGIRPYGRR